MSQVGLVAMLLAAVAGTAWATADGPAVAESRLDNGVRLLASPQHNVPMVVVRVLLDAGARRDPAGQAGLAHLTADLLTEGTDSRDAETLAEAIDFIGASLSSSAEMDYAWASLKVLKKDLDVGLELLADIVRHPAFAAEEVARRREAILAGIRDDEDDPTQVAAKAFRRALYGDEPYGHPVEGTADSVAALDRDAVEAFYAAQYGPARTMIVMVGDVTAEEARAGAERWFGTWSGAAVQPFAYPPVAATAPATVRIDKPVTQAAVIVGHRGVARDHPDYEPLQVMNYILGGGGFASRLLERIRTQAGLAYSVTSYFATGKDTGSFQVVLQTKNASVGEALAKVRGELETIRTTPVSATELREAQQYLTGSFPLRLDSNNDIADFVSGLAFYDLGFDYAERYLERVAAVTLDDVQRVARAHVHPDRLIEVVVGDLDAVDQETAAPPTPAP